MLPESDRRILTEDVLEECWHESKDTSAVGKIKLSGGITIQTCYKCKAIMSDSYHVVNENRTFTTWQDTGDLKDKIVEMGEFNKSFLDHCFKTYDQDVRDMREGKISLMEKTYIDWLMDEIRFPELVVGGWKKRGKG